MAYAIVKVCATHKVKLSVPPTPAGTSRCAASLHAPKVCFTCRKAHLVEKEKTRFRRVSIKQLTERIGIDTLRFLCSCKRSWLSLRESCHRRRLRGYYSRFWIAMSICSHTPRKSLLISRLENRKTDKSRADKNAESSSSYAIPWGS